jgi:hypothetical protein
MDHMKSEIAAAAARLVVEEGADYGAAKRRAVKLLGLPQRTALPDNDVVEDAVLDYIQVFCAETQADELRALRQLALAWMQRLRAFRPYLSGAVWHGTATRKTDIYLQLFCDDAKSLEIQLINQRQDYVPREVTGFHGERVEALSLHAFSQDLQEDIGVHLMLYDHDALRGALKPDSKGRVPRGDEAAVMQRLADDEA